MAKVGIIGTGWGARVQVPAFRAAGLHVSALAGQDQQKSERIAGELGVPKAFADWRRLVSLPDIDLVSIVTPPSLHLEMTAAALRAGKHVLCEKPTALDATEAAEMCRFHQEHPEQIAIIDHELRFLPTFLEARRRKEQIGPLRFAEVRYASPSRADRNRTWNWWSDRTHGGGVLGAVGSHAVDTFRYIGCEINAVQAVLKTFIDQRPATDGRSVEVTSDDFAALHVRFEGGGIGTIFLTVVDTVDEPTTFTFHGEHGGLRLVDHELFAASVGGRWENQQIEIEREWTQGNSPGGAFGTGTFYLGRALCEALDGGNRQALAPAATFHDGLRQQSALDAARRSHEEGGRWIDF